MHTFRRDNTPCASEGQTTSVSRQSISHVPSKARTAAVFSATFVVTSALSSRRNTNILLRKLRGSIFPSPRASRAGKGQHCRWFDNGWLSASRALPVVAQHFANVLSRLRVNLIPVTFSPVSGMPADEKKNQKASFVHFSFCWQMSVSWSLYSASGRLYPKKHTVNKKKCRIYF